jgi:ubiquinone/menaquinone biosynthesis C-methylase UbiE
MSRRAYFNEAASTWDEKYDTPELANFLGELVLKFGLEPGEKVLDAGTGTGILIPYLVRAVGPSGSITAIDYAEKMVDICKSKYTNFKNVKIELQDVETLKLPPDTFDVATCFGLFPHIENKEMALIQLNRVLKNGGKLIIAHALSSAEIKVHHKNTSLAVSRDMLPEEKDMMRLLNNAGYFNVSIHDKPGCYLCTSKKL